MKTFRYKDNNGTWVRSIYPKPTENEQIITDGVISIIFIVGLIILAIKVL